MKRIACWVMMGAKNNIKDRPNSYEIFGIDYMVDINFNTWLIEVNKNPALEYSTVKLVILLFIKKLSGFMSLCIIPFACINSIILMAATIYFIVSTGFGLCSEREGPNKSIIK